MSGDSLTVLALAIERFRGFERGGFRLDDLAPGINLVHGPNASGKSTTARALRELLWPAAEPVAGRRLSGALLVGTTRWEIELDHERAAYRRDGEPSPPPVLPPADVRDRYHLALGELLAAETRVDGFAAAIAREAAGGYDLEAAAKAVGAKQKVTLGYPQEKRLRAAAAEVRRIDDEQRGLAKEARALAGLRTEQEEALRAAVELERVERVLAWQGARAQREETAGSLAAFPPALAELTGRERQELAAIAADLAEAEARREGVATRLAEARRRLEAAALPPGGVPAELAGALRQHCARLRDLDQEAGHRARSLAEAEARRALAERAVAAALGGTATEEGLADLAERPSPAEWRELVELAHRAERLHAEDAALADAAAALGARAAADSAGGEAGGDPGHLERSARLLGEWLRAPARPFGDRLAGTIAALLVVAAGAAGALWLDPRLWGLAGVGVFLLLWIAADLVRVARDRRHLEERHAQLAVAQPERWQRPVVVEALAAAETAWLAARARADQEREAAERLAEIARDRSRLAAGQSRLASARDDLLLRLGLAPLAAAAKEGVGGEIADAPLALIAQAVAGWREAAVDVATQEAGLARVGEERGAVLGALGEGLAGFGVTPPADLAAALGAVEALAERAREHRDAAPEIAKLAAEGGERQQAERQLSALAARRAELYGRAGVEAGDDAALDRLLEQLPRYREVVAQRDRERGVEESCVARLTPEDAALRDRPRTDLEAERDRLAATSAGRDELAERIHRLEERIGLAKGRHELEEAQAALAEARRDLREERERETEAVIARLLVDWLRETAGVRSRPAVLRGAERTFARITRGRFELAEPRGAPPRFRAREVASGRVRELAELSEGVRMQLLMAVRLAFIEHREEGLRLPLVLDHSLATADPEAEREVIAAVVELARLGRQIFYFTPRPESVALWREAVAEATDSPALAVIDLREVRGMAEAERAPRAAAAPRPPSVPPPAGRDRRSYGEALGVPGLDPRGDPGAIHLWHVVADPEALHPLLARGIARWGELQALVRAGENGLLEAGASRRAEARGRCVEVLFHAWRRGRGRPVDRQALADSGAVTERYLDEVAVRLEACEGEPARLIAALHGGEVKSFRKEKTEQLERHLVEEGFLDEREVLASAALRERALAALAAEIAGGLLDLTDLDDLLAHLPDLEG